MTSSQIDYSELTRVIADEVALYREMFFLADKQRDWLENGSDTDIGTTLEQIERVQKQIVASLMDRAFAGSTAKLVMRALSAKSIPPGELDQIRRMIDEMGGEAQ